MRLGRVIIALLFGGGVAVAANLPLSWAAKAALPEVLTSQVAFGGSVWDGHVSGGHILGRPAPSVTIKASALKLVTGQNFANIKSEGSGLSLTGFAKIGRISDMKVTLPMNFMAYFDHRLSGVEGDFKADVSDAQFGQICNEAQGTAQTDILTRNQASWGWAGPMLSGPIHCESGNVVINLSGQDAGETVRADITLSPSGQYRYELAIISQDPRAGLALPLFGFEKRKGEFILAEIGNWQELL